MSEEHVASGIIAGDAARPRGRESSVLRDRAVAWFEATSRFRWVLLAVVVVLYGPSLAGDFVLDDVRALRVFREYQRGERTALDLYRFLPGGEANAAEREAGHYPWWAQDELRYQHFRPLSERLLYGQYHLFGGQAAGFRLVSLGLYAFGVLIVFELFRIVAPTERLARWAGLAYAVAAGHAIPVVFISAQCDVIALAAGGGAILLAARFVRDGGAGRLAVAAGLYVLGLMAKEMVLPVAVLPVCLGLVFRQRNHSGALGLGRGVPLSEPPTQVGGGARPTLPTALPVRFPWRRATTATAVLAGIGLVWLALYAAGGFGSNAIVMLDPLHTPLDYLKALPGRAVLLLSTWVIPVNPFMFQFHQQWGAWVPVYGIIGGVGLALLAVMFRRRHRGDRGVAAMALWPVVFLPLLACTPADDRVMILPSIGFAYLSAAWLTRPRAGATARPRAFPFIWFIILQAATVPATAWLMQFMEVEAQRHLRLMVESFGRPPQEGDRLFFVNTTRNFEALFTQDRLRRVPEVGPTRVAVLCDVAAPKVTVLDDRTLRLESGTPPFFSSYVGLMGTSRQRPWLEGDVIRLPDFEARIARVESGAVTALEIRFTQALMSDSYRFFWSEPEAPPRLWPIGSEPRP